MFKLFSRRPGISADKDTVTPHRVAAMEAEVDALIAQAAIPEPTPMPLPWVAPETPTIEATE